MIKTNNVLIIGEAKLSDYEEVLLLHCDPDGLNIHAPIESWNTDLEKALYALQIPGHKLSESIDYLKFDPDRVILFTDYTGIEVVTLLELCVNNGIELIVKNPRKSKYTKIAGSGDENYMKMEKTYGQK